MCSKVVRRVCARDYWNSGKSKANATLNNRAHFWTSCQWVLLRPFFPPKSPFRPSRTFDPAFFLNIKLALKFCPKSDLCLTDDATNFLSSVWMKLQLMHLIQWPLHWVHTIMLPEEAVFAFFYSNKFVLLIKWPLLWTHKLLLPEEHIWDLLFLR